MIPLVARHSQHSGRLLLLRNISSSCHGGLVVTRTFSSQRSPSNNDNETSSAPKDRSKMLWRDKLAEIRSNIGTNRGGDGGTSSTQTSSNDTVKQSSSSLDSNVSPEKTWKSQDPAKQEQPSKWMRTLENHQGKATTSTAQGILGQQQQQPEGTKGTNEESKGTHHQSLEQLLRSSLRAPPKDGSTAVPEWRRASATSGAREYRKKKQQEEYQQKNASVVGRPIERVPYSEPMSELARIMNRQKLDPIAPSPTAKQRQPVPSNNNNKSDKQVTLPPNPISVLEASALFRRKVDIILKKLKQQGAPATADEDYLVDIDTLEILALDFHLDPIRSQRRAAKSYQEEKKELLVQRRAVEEEEELVEETTQATSVGGKLKPRPPVVTIMGHVDHGKTTLMDALRRMSSNKDADNSKTKKKKKKKNKEESTSVKSGSDGDVAGTEAGGITQAITAFQVSLENQDNAVTFLDTPGHAAFRAMRESGSNAADVVVLVVAADDGVSPQTIEIIEFFKSIVQGGGDGGISLVVAMTKIDKPGIDVDESRYRIENELLEHGIVSEGLSGSTESKYGPPVQIVPVSGITGEGLNDLIDSLTLQSEVMELKADPTANAEGVIMDAQMEKGFGVVASCVVRWGSLERGDIVLSGVHVGKVKTLKNTKNKAINVALPSQPVRIVGFSTMPKAGDPFVCVDSQEVADKLIARRVALGETNKPNRTEFDGQVKLEVTGKSANQAAMLKRIHDKYGYDPNAENAIRVPIILKADADGTLTALRESIIAIGTNSTLEWTIDPISEGIGSMTENDVLMAQDSSATVFSFNVTHNKAALALAEREGVTVKSSSVIYSLLEEAKEIFASYLPGVRTEQIIGAGKIKTVFDIDNGKDRIAGLQVTDGSLMKSKEVGEPEYFYRVFRRGKQISPEGDVLVTSSLKSFKDDVEAVQSGNECGVGLKDFLEFEVGDVIECYSIEIKKEFL